MGINIVLVSLSVRPSVRLSSRCSVRSIFFEPLVGFTNNSAQMSSMMSRCALRMFDKGRFKVKVKVQGKTLHGCKGQLDDVTYQISTF